MSEPQWVYRQRRQRAAVAVVRVIGAIAMAIVIGPALSGGLDLGGLGGRPRVAIDKPDPDAILAREQRQIGAANQRKADRRQARAERRARPRRPKKPSAPARATTPSGGSPTPAATP